MFRTLRSIRPRRGDLGVEHHRRLCPRLHKSLSRSGFTTSSNSSSSGSGNRKVMNVKRLACRMHRIIPWTLLLHPSHNNSNNNNSNNNSDNSIRHPFTITVHSANHRERCRLQSLVILRCPGGPCPVAVDSKVLMEPLVIRLRWDPERVSDRCKVVEVDLMSVRRIS